MGLHSKASALLTRLLTGGTVLTGPFARMEYIRGSVGSTLPPKLLGTCEMELHEVIAEIILAAPATVIDAGAAEGQRGLRPQPKKSEVRSQRSGTCR